MRLRVGVIGAAHAAPVQAVANGLEAFAQGEVISARVVAGPVAEHDLDVLVAMGFDARAAAELLRHLPAGLPVLWMGGVVTAAPDAVRPTGFVSDNADERRLTAAIQALAAGLHVAEGERSLPTPAAPPLADPLTARELEVFELMAKGLANREIAQVLGITSHTAKFHVAQILEKTGSATRTEAVRQGLRMGLIGV
jgi:DNA-binding CsgD family transcriptional regulator